MKLEIGYNHSFEIRREQCIANCKDNFSIVYLSDLHLTKFSRSISKRISETIEQLNPTIVLLGGDYVDSKKGLIELNHFLKSISHRQNVFAVAGNHDYSLGVCQIQEMMIRNNVVWLEDKTINVNIENSIVKIDGNFITDRAGNTDFSILLLHKPKHIHTFYENYNLALAGHLHGSQVVFWESNDELFPGRLFYRWNILKKKKDKCYYFISKGLGDTLPIRYNCKRDLLFIQVTNNN